MVDENKEFDALREFASRSPIITKMRVVALGETCLHEIVFDPKLINGSCASVADSIRIAWKDWQRKRNRWGARIPRIRYSSSVLTEEEYYTWNARASAVLEAWFKVSGIYNKVVRYEATRHLWEKCVVNLRVVLDSNLTNDEELEIGAKIVRCARDVVDDWVGPGTRFRFWIHKEGDE